MTLFKTRKDLFQSKEDTGTANNFEILLGKSNKELRIPDLTLSKLSALHKETSEPTRWRGNTTRHQASANTGEVSEKIERMPPVDKFPATNITSESEHSLDEKLSNNSIDESAAKMTIVGQQSEQSTLNK